MRRLILIFALGLSGCFTIKARDNSEPLRVEVMTSDSIKVVHLNSDNQTIGELRKELAFMRANNSDLRGQLDSANDRLDSLIAANNRISDDRNDAIFKLVECQKENIKR